MRFFNKMTVRLFRVVRFFKKRKPGKGIFFGDIDNLVISSELPSPSEISMVGGFDRLMKKIAAELGEISNAVVFLPFQPASVWAKTFHQLGFYSIVCPRIPVKERPEEEKDTVDETLINYGQWAIENIKDLTYFCLGSGDKDFAPLVRRAIRKGLKIAIVAGSEKSLSADLIDLADKIYFFKPTRAG